MLSSTIHSVAHRTGWSLRRAHKQRAMRIVMLHGVVAAEAPALDRQLLWLREHFELVALSDVLARLDQSDRVTGREVALTFDDGLRNNAVVVAPLLARHEAPATFFVCPGLVEAGRWLWTHEARARLQTLEMPERIDFVEAAGIGASVGPPAIVEEMKLLPLTHRKQAEAQLREITKDFAPSDAQRAAFDVMRWDELQQLDASLITIGSHSVDHPILPTLDDAELDEQLRASRALLEERLDRSVPLFCYPNGSEDARVRACARKHYDAAVTTEPGLVRASAERHGLPRIGGTDDVPELAWRFHRP